MTAISKQRATIPAAIASQDSDRNVLKIKATKTTNATNFQNQPPNANRLAASCRLRISKTPESTNERKTHNH